MSLTADLYMSIASRHSSGSAIACRAAGGSMPDTIASEIAMNAFLTVSRFLRDIGGRPTDLI